MLDIVALSSAFGYSLFTDAIVFLAVVELCAY